MKTTKIINYYLNKCIIFYSSSTHTYLKTYSHNSLKGAIHRNLLHFCACLEGLSPLKRGKNTGNVLSKADLTQVFVFTLNDVVVGGIY